MGPDGVRTRLSIDVRSATGYPCGMAVTASKLRENIYKILDQVLATGEPVEIIRSGRKLKIVAVEEPRRCKLDRLAKRPETLLADPEELVHLDWSREWRP